MSPVVVTFSCNPACPLNPNLRKARSLPFPFLPGRSCPSLSPGINTGSCSRRCPLHILSLLPEHTCCLGLAHMHTPLPGLLASSWCGRYFVASWGGDNTRRSASGDGGPLTQNTHVTPIPKRGSCLCQLHRSSKDTSPGTSAESDTPAVVREGPWATLTRPGFKEVSGGV